MLGQTASPRHWRLMLGDELMAELAFESYETPWLTVSVFAHPGLERFRPYFTDSETWPEEDDAVFDAMIEEVRRRGKFRLIDDAGVEANGFSLVNLDDRSANLRC